MKDKLLFALKKCKTVVIAVLIVWIIFSIVLIPIITISWVDAVQNDNGNFIENLLSSNIQDVFSNFFMAFSENYVKTYLKNEMYSAIILAFFAAIGFVKTLPKHEYTDIEHGSSDWANGEQYSILSRNKGILLAEKHYLPVDKRGNVNVLVVGRFWIW